MTTLLYVLLVLATLASLAAGSIARQLRSSDAAGNGLAQAWLAAVLAVTWLLVGTSLVITAMRAPHENCATDLPWSRIGLATAILFAAALAAQFATLGVLFDSAHSGLRPVLQAAVAVVPIAFVVFAAFRGLGLPLPPAFALWTPAAVVFVGALLPWFELAALRRAAAEPKELTLFHVAYPALVVRATESVHVLRQAGDVENLPGDLLAELANAIVIDANRMTYTVRRLHTEPPAFSILRHAEALALTELQTLLLGIAHLHVDTQQDARIRRLIPMQRDVSALSFVVK